MTIMGTNAENQKKQPVTRSKKIWRLHLQCTLPPSEIYSAVDYSGFTVTTGSVLFLCSHGQKTKEKRRKTDIQSLHC